jgi:hypothetical protein
LGGLDLMLAFVVLNDGSLELFIVGAVEHGPERGHAQCEQQHSRGCANETRRQAEQLTHSPKSIGRVKTRQGIAPYARDSWQGRHTVLRYSRPETHAHRSRIRLTRRPWSPIPGADTPGRLSALGVLRRVRDDHEQASSDRPAGDSDENDDARVDSGRPEGGQAGRSGSVAP